MNRRKFLKTIGGIGAGLVIPKSLTSEKETSLEQKIYQTKRKIDFLVVHHTASDSGNVNTIRAYHKFVKGWDDIGYHFVINKNGTIDNGRPISIQGAHIKGKNTGSIGIAMIGNFENHNPTQEQINSLHELLKAGIKTYDLTSDKIYGHKELASTLCPGKYVNINNIRETIK